jgi:hypothetical protein
MLETDPPPGISCWPKGDKITELEAGPFSSPNRITSFKHFLLRISIHFGTFRVLGSGPDSRRVSGQKSFSSKNERELFTCFPSLQ